MTFPNTWVCALEQNASRTCVGQGSATLLTWSATLDFTLLVSVPQLTKMLSRNDLEW